VPTYKEARETYMNQLIGEACTGYSEEINAKALEWGKLNEDAAAAAYEFESGNTIEKIGFAHKDESLRCGASPDFKIIGKDHGGEIKCPITPQVHIDFILNGIIKDEYITQMQFGMWVTGWHHWDFASYHPRMKKKMIHYVTIERDQELMEYFDNEVPKFIKEMDEKLERIGVSYSDR
jgi:exodeoxyribonuclease (lambda-induced)